LYKTLTLMLYNLINHPNLMGARRSCGQYDLERGEIPIKEWGQHLLQYYNGRFPEDLLFGLFLYNTNQRHTNNSEGNFFFNLIASLVETHQLFKNSNNSFNKKIHIIYEC
jgi:hypothetical protein